MVTNRTNHDIQIVDDHGWNWSIRIDSKELKLSKRLCRIDLGRKDTIGSVLNSIEKVFVQECTFSELRDQINAINLLTILDALYRKETVELFASNYVAALDALPPDRSPIGYRDFFKAMFGFNEHAKHGRVMLYKEFKEITSEEYNRRLRTFQSRKRDQVVRTAENSQFCVELIGSAANTVMFKINDDTIDICKSSRCYINNAARILGYIESLGAAFQSDNSTEVRRIVAELGSKATVDLMRICYPKQAVDFFVRAGDKRVLMREKPRPFKILESYMRAPHDGKQRAYFFHIVNAMEDKMPAWSQQLIDGNTTEVYSGRSSWTIFFFPEAISTISFARLFFAGDDALVKECQTYCIHHARFGQKDFSVQSLIAYSRMLYRIVDIFYNKLDLNIRSISELSSYHMQMYIAHNIQSGTYTLRTLNLDIVILRQFHRYITGIDSNSPESPFFNLHNISFPSNPTAPLSQTVRQFITERIEEIPPAMRLALKIAYATGCRSGSLETLTIHSLIEETGRYRIRIFYKKTFRYRIKNNLPAYADYPIPNMLGEELKEFIKDTEGIRARLDKPYLLVYYPSYRRNDTHSPPSIVQSRSFNNFWTRLLESAGVKDDDGLLATCSMRSIRAEVGRALFAEGKSPSQVSTFLGNSPIVSRQHYDHLFPMDEAVKYNTLYKSTIEKAAFTECSDRKQKETIMYGECAADRICPGKDCRICPERITCKGDSTH